MTKIDIVILSHYNKELDPIFNLPAISRYY